MHVLANGLAHVVGQRMLGILHAQLLPVWDKPTAGSG
jgi:hypothetical protein